VVLAAAVVWRKLRQGDLLKYEFVTTVTHKFRTPLTHIKWASENLSGSLLSADARVQLGYIQGANEKLVELTGLLVNISEAENSDYQYRINRGNISNLVEEVMDGLKEHYAIKKITPSRNIEHELYANFDESRVKFVLQTFIENAVHYTPEGGTLIISLARAGRNILCSVKDSGIGIPKDELPRLFSKFYRGTGAKLADTEGMGIGLYISKEILKRHDGKIWAESEGPGKGSTFSFSLRAVK
jgi:signal transduction histidine kinase